MSTHLHGARVTLRPWADADRAPFAALNADPQVMLHMTKALSRAESDALVDRIRAHFEAHGFGLWTLEVPALGFAGFVGLSARVPFDIPVAGIVTPPHEIGWRLARPAWGHGYASEAAALALRHGFETVGLAQIVAFAAVANHASQAVMRRIGLTPRGAFDHPRLPEGHRSRQHVLYVGDAPHRGAAHR